MEKGQDGAVYVGGTQVAQVRRYALNNVADVQDTTVGGDGGGRIQRPTLESCRGTVEAFWLAADAGQAALAIGSTVSLELRRQGTGSGLPQAAIANAVISGIDEPWTPDEYNAVTFNFVGGVVDRTPQT